MEKGGLWQVGRQHGQDRLTVLSFPLSGGLLGLPNMYVGSRHTSTRIQQLGGGKLAGEGMGIKVVRFIVGWTSMWRGS